MRGRKGAFSLVRFECTTYIFVYCEHTNLYVKIITCSKEAGAFDGLTYSNSLHFETYHKWSGLLVEPIPQEFSKLTASGRAVWAAKTCLSTSTRPQIVEFNMDDVRSGIDGKIHVLKPDQKSGCTHGGV
jgi:hypothetical protein